MPEAIPLEAESPGDASKRKVVDFGTALLAAALLLAAGTRAAFMSQPMRFDEATTYNHYVARAPEKLFHYTAPNNHVFHTLLVWLVTNGLGDAPWVIRLPAFAFGVACVPLVFILSRSLGGSSAGGLAAIATAVYPFLIGFSTNARGYTMICCCTLGLAILIDRQLKKGSHPLKWLAVLSALGMWVNPAMLYPLAGLGVWYAVGLICQREPPAKLLLEHLLPWCLLTASGTLVLYTPTLMYEGGWHDLVDNRYVQPFAPSVFFAELDDHAYDVGRRFIRDLPLPVVMVLGGLFCCGTLRLSLNRDSSGSCFVPAMLCGVCALFSAKQSIPFARNWIFLIPLILVVADVGFGWLTAWMPRRVVHVLTVLLLVGAAFYANDLVRRNAIAEYYDTGRLPRTEEVLEYLQSHLRSGDVVVAQVPHDEQLAYYLARAGLDVSVSRTIRPRQRCFVVTRDQQGYDTNVAGLRQVLAVERTSIFVNFPASTEADADGDND